MPTMMRFGGVRVVIYPNDHRPAHVHLIGNGCEGGFVLEGHDGPELRENIGFSRTELNGLRQELARHLPKIRERWIAIHGNP